VAMAEIYRDEFGAASTVIPYCWTGLDPTTGEGKLAQYGLTTGEYVCIAGRLIPENNAVPVTRAYLDGAAPWPLVVLGTANYDSPVQRELSALASQDPRLQLVGHVHDRAEFAAMVRGARLYVHAHSVGGINPSLVEAMGLGAFILALDTPFNREALGEAGSYFSAFGARLTEQLEAFVDQSSVVVGEQRAAARARVAREFGLDDVTDAVEQVLAAAAGARSRSSVSIDTRWSTAISPPPRRRPVES
jgi:glycosyltransferase involved in cell wall biosynthesis